MPWILMTHVRKFLPNHHCAVVTRYVRFGLGLRFRLRSGSELAIRWRNGRQSQTQEMLYGVVSRCTKNYCTSANLEGGGRVKLWPYLCKPRIFLILRPFWPWPLYQKFVSWSNHHFVLGSFGIVHMVMVSIEFKKFICQMLRALLFCVWHQAKIDHFYQRTFEMLWKFISYGPNWNDHIYHSTLDQNNYRLCF